jgi:5-methylcytosine-specific restriction enzyme subunit McrC
MLPGISPIEITSPIFNQVRIHRNNQFYGFIMKVCQLIHENILPSETIGHFKFSDFTRDEQKMNRLFEEFVRNFYRLEQIRYPTVRIEHIQWQLTTTDRISRELLPQMRTDITLENDHEKIIIDAKYYRETLSEFYNSEKVRSVNLYQLFSYLMNQRDGSDKTTATTGILLYPTIDKDYNLNYNFERHQIQVRTVNLNDHWSSIEERLKEIIGCAIPHEV